MPYVSKGGKITQNTKNLPAKKHNIGEAGKPKKAAAIKNKSPFQEGDILVSDWGYDQSNIDFYKVINSTEKTVVLQPIGRDTRRGEAWGNYYATPDETKKGKPFRRKIHTDTSSPGVAINSFECAFKWDGKPKHGTDYYNKASKPKSKKTLKKAIVRRK